MRGEKLRWNPREGELCYLLTDPVLAKQIRRKQSIFFSGKEGNGFVHKFSRHVGLKERLKSALLIPLRGDGQTLIGICVMGEMRHAKRSSFTSANVQFATALAAQAAIAFERQRGIELAAERSRVMESLHEVGNAITASLTLDQVLQRIVEAARALLKAEMASIFLVRREGYLRLPTSSGSSPKALRKPEELKIARHQGL